MIRCLFWIAAWITVWVFMIVGAIHAEWAFACFCWLILDEIKKNGERALDSAAGGA